ncbi:sulfatase-like hydrolase/transferase [Lentisphaera profundi]|uniref:Sulfatase-like hydrolase/transferase n=1 Tax=Lentisphaera profundi TaxID=1658616 RepID=A0ABY7VXZ2_9BACT|nr:sulfatase-like hydrolase/transferase [Lentisphaera profundi]WDE97661.1 sulfatase-like hydrolase/transferase [Lentisphaera profundi]
MNKSHFLLAAASAFISPLISAENAKPNVILIMADDLGWADTGFNGSKVVKTPHLDQMAAEGLQFNRFYSASSVCSPTRASVLTGRNPYRTGVPTANQGFLRPEEITLPEILREQGYATGHFGKWHLGTLTHTEKDANRGKPGNTKEFNPPKLHGYDNAFVTESKVPTYDPMLKPAKFAKGESSKLGWEYLKEGQESQAYGTFYWDIEGNKVSDNLSGDDSRVIMDRVLPFIDQSLEDNKPFISVIWFHTPHLPCVAGPKHQEMYKEHPIHLRNYAGCITAMDEQIGRLRKHLAAKGADQNTMIWFCSDNGPESQERPDNGSAGHFRGRKRDLYEGGVRVPSVMVWPAKISQAKEVNLPCITSDYLPTVLDALKISHPEPSYALDGRSLMPIIEGDLEQRNSQIGLMYSNRIAWHKEDFKLISYNSGQKYELYNLVLDPSEKSDIASQNPELVEELKKDMLVWHASVKNSFDGTEYGTKSLERLGKQWSSPLNTQPKSKKTKSKKKKSKKEKK